MSAETLFGEMRNTRPSGKRQGGRRRRDYVNDRDEESDFQILAYSGGPMDEAISSLQKCIRLGREQGACYWGMQVWGKYPQYFWRRMMIICSEDCAADPMTAVQLQALYQNGCAATSKDGKPYERRVEGHIETHAILMLCRAAKSREPADAVGTVKRATNDPDFTAEPPDVALDVHTRRGKQRGRNIRFFGEEGRRVAGPEYPNKFEIQRWGFHLDNAKRPEDGGDPDLELPPCKDPLDEVR